MEDVPPVAVMSVGDRMEIGSVDEDVDDGICSGL